MAHYFTNFSFLLPLMEAKTYVLEISHQVSLHRAEEAPLPPDFPESLKDVIEDWTFEVADVPEGIWFHTDCGGIDAACAFVQHLLQKFNSPACVTFEWSHDCSHPRFNAFGGGAAIVTATEIKTLNTSDWLRAQVPNHTNHEHHHCPPGGSPV
jgi:hypothetical protein